MVATFRDSDGIRKVVPRAPNGLHRAVVYGHTFYAHPQCIEGFKEDRRAGLIYPTVGTGYMQWEDYSIGERVCALCNEEENAA